MASSDFRTSRNPISEAEEALAWELTKKADRILKEVDGAFIFTAEAAQQQSLQKIRDFPKFQKDELKLGPILGMGSFSGVYEVADIEPMRNLMELADHEQGNGPSKAVEEHPPSGDTGDDTDNDNNNHTNDVTAPPNWASAEDHDDHEKSHYEVQTAKEIMAQRCNRFGSARYAIKKLLPNVNEYERIRGILDLAIEIKFLKVLWHPNIGTYDCCSHPHNTF